MKIQLTIDGTLVEAELNNHPVARELAQTLPLDLIFNDFNQVEKVATLAQPLTLRGVPDADAPGPGEIGYYAPTRGLVLYYGSPGRWPGLGADGALQLRLERAAGAPGWHAHSHRAGAHRRLLNERY